ncbi:MAG TPA: pyruvate carboxylase subunit B [Casimicrobiaceae bacterium]|nr:pyruvate carboxylase subunit B [Casimicrobiaceae bacterium]
MTAPQSDHRFDFIDVTLRDAHQCLWSTRMTTAMMTPIIDAIDRAGYAFINILGGAVFDVCVRYLQENPWDRIGLLCERFATPCDGLTRGQSLYTFELFPDDIVALNSHALARRGIEVLTVYDALNDNRNIVSSVRSGREAGMKINAMITYTLSPVHTDAYYVERAKELVALEVDFISFKDPTGLLTPQRGRTLFPAIVQAAGSIPVQLHSHCQSGLAPEVYEIAMQSGFRLGYTATEPLANGASLPATEDVLARARRLGFDTVMDDAALTEVSGYFDWLCEREGKPRGEIAAYDPALYEHQIPGGMISNLRYQLQTMKLEHRLPEILEEVARVRHDLGYPIVVSPFAQYVVTQATLNVVQGERYKTIPDEIRKYARGYYGRLAARPSDEFLERANIRDSEYVTEAPAAHLSPWVPRLRAELGATAGDEDVLLAAFYDRKLIAPLRNPAPECHFRTTPLTELVGFLTTRKDIAHARIRFAGTDMMISA